MEKKMVDKIHQHIYLKHPMSETCFYCRICGLVTSNISIDDKLRDDCLPISIEIKSIVTERKGFRELF